MTKRKPSIFYENFDKMYYLCPKIDCDNVSFSEKFTSVITAVDIPRNDCSHNLFWDRGSNIIILKVKTLHIGKYIQRNQN